MEVPITSDLAGYQQYWTPYVRVLIVEGAVISVLLAGILIALVRR